MIKLAKKIDIDIEKLRKLYETQDLTNKQIGEKLGCSVDLVKHYARLHKMKKFDKYAYITKEFLEDLYINQRLSMSQIAEKLNTNKGVIQNRIEKFGLRAPDGLYTVSIPKEELEGYLEEGLTYQKIAQIYNCSQSVIVDRINKYGLTKRDRRKHNIPEEELRDLYINKKFSMKKIGELYGCPSEIIRSRLNEIGAIKSKDIKKRIDFPLEKVQELLDKRYTYEQIGKIIGLETNTVANQVRKRGLKRKKSSAIFDVPYEELYKLYITQELSEETIGRMYDCSRSSVARRLEELGILREYREVPVISDEDLENLYIKDGLSINEISETTGVKSYIISAKIAELNLKKSTKWEHITVDLLRDLYVKQGMNVPEIAKKLKCSRDIINTRIYDYGLTSERTPEEHLDSIYWSFHNASLLSRSAGEKELEKMYPTPWLNYHKVIGLELDLYYPKEKFAIEYNGDFFHGSSSTRPSRHITKTKRCDEKGIHLVNIFERFWKDKNEKPKIINILNNALAPTELQRIEGTIRIVREEEEKQFIKENCLASYVKSDVCIGTYSTEGVLLNLLSFKKINKGYKISRFATKTGYTESYGSLFKYFLGYYNPSYVEVQCDRRYYDGSLFKSFGFKFVKYLKADYEYVYGFKGVSRTAYRKNPAKYAKYYKVYDCGRVLLEYVPSNITSSI